MIRELNKFLGYVRLRIYKNGDVEKELCRHGFGKKNFPEAKKILGKLHELDPKYSYSKRFQYQIDEIKEELLEYRKECQRKKKESGRGQKMSARV